MPEHDWIYTVYGDCQEEWHSDFLNSKKENLYKQQVFKMQIFIIARLQEKQQLVYYTW